MIESKPETVSVKIYLRTHELLKEMQKEARKATGKHVDFADLIESAVKAQAAEEDGHLVAIDGVLFRATQEEKAFLIKALHAHGSRKTFVQHIVGAIKELVEVARLNRVPREASAQYPSREVDPLSQKTEAVGRDPLHPKKGRKGLESGERRAG
jgi:hypothetical protein